MKQLLILLLVALGVFMPLVAGAEMYQWVDEKGVKHFSNSPPPEGVTADRTRDEIKYDKAADEAGNAEKERIVKEVEAANRQAEKDAVVAKEQKARQEALDAKKAEQAELRESVISKRRYIKRRGKTDINKLIRLNEEIEALQKDKNADPEKIRELEEEAEEVREKFYQKSGRGRKGTKDEIQELHRLREEIEAAEAAQK